MTGKYKRGDSITSRAQWIATRAELFPELREKPGAPQLLDVTIVVVGAQRRRRRGLGVDEVRLRHLLDDVADRGLRHERLFGEALGGEGGDAVGQVGLFHRHPL